LVLIVLGIPMIRRQVPRIDVMLMPHLAVTDDVWNESHRRSGWDFVIIGTGLIILAVWSARATGSTAEVREFLTIAAVTALLVAALRSMLLTSRLIRERDLAE
jgi:hypothetical protein